MPKAPPPACIACGGSGRSSVGGRCHPCRGTGDKLNEQERDKLMRTQVESKYNHAKKKQTKT